MSRKLAGLMVAGVLIVGCSESPPVPRNNSVKSDTTTSPASSGTFALQDFVVGDAIRYENLTIFPVSSRAAKTEDRYITLDEGLKAGTVEIRELAATYERQSSDAANADASTIANNDDGDTPADEQPTRHRSGGNAVLSAGNDVNTLIVVNNSDKPLYLMPGEIIIGGSQDRTIANELVLAAHSSPTRIPVFCVESGRWGEKGADETLAQIQNANSSPTSELTVLAALPVDHASSRLAQDADRGKFVATVGHLSKASRVAVQSEKDQSAVWESVAIANNQSGLSPVSGAFTANYVNVDNIKKLEPYLEHLQTPVSKIDQVVGVLVAINGKIETIDVFDSTPLFQKVWPKLLKSYALDATNAQEANDTKIADMKRDAAESFLAEALGAKVASSEAGQGVALTRREGQHVLSFSSHVEQPAAAPAAMGGMGGVHFSGYAK
ncbi:MAG: hypothetical protein JWP89_6997 [Schlesneria sp.]|nr:hypothetical protein [Schlesneria sp.]